MQRPLMLSSVCLGDVLWAALFPGEGLPAAWTCPLSICFGSGSRKGHRYDSCCISGRAGIYKCLVQEITF